MRVALFACLFALSACGGTGVCQQRTGTGVVKFTARSGNCGPIGESVVPAQDSTPSPGCTGTVTLSDDNCEETVDQTCPLPDGSHLRQTGTGTFNEAGTSATAVFSFTLTNSAGAVACYGTYDATFSKN